MTNDEFFEELAGCNCPVCGYPLVIEDGFPVCYMCGWEDELQEDDKEEYIE